jgi:type VI secretion system protein ImpC
MADPTTENQQEQQAETTVEPGEFSNLLQKEFKPKTDRAREAVAQAVQTLAEQVLRDTGVVSSDVVKTVEALVGELDRTLSAQVNAILHREELQELEGAWRGLHYLVNNTETSSTTPRPTRC